MDAKETQSIGTIVPLDNHIRTERMERLMREQSLNLHQLVKLTGISYSGLRHIRNGGNTTKLEKVAAALGTTVAYLDGKEGAVDDLAIYTLSDCAESTTHYRLKLHSGALRLDGAPLFNEQGEIVVLVAPWDAESQRQARWVVWRKNGESRALVAHAVPDGDTIRFYPAGISLDVALATNSELVESAGRVIGAIQRIVDAPFLFQNPY